MDAAWPLMCFADFIASPGGSDFAATRAGARQAAGHNGHQCQKGRLVRSGPRRRWTTSLLALQRASPMSTQVDTLASEEMTHKFTSLSASIAMNGSVCRWRLVPLHHMLCPDQLRPDVQNQACRKHLACYTTSYGRVGSLRQRRTDSPGLVLACDNLGLQRACGCRNFRV